MKPHYLLSRMLGIIALAAVSSVASAESFGPTLDKISERGKIYLGHRESSVPFSFVTTEDSEPKGLSIDLCRQVVKAIEEKLGKKLVVQPVNLSANSRIMMVKTGMADIECGVTTNTVSRQQLVAFSNTFFVSEVKGLVPVELAGKSLKDLEGKRFLTVLGSTADRLVKQASMSRGVTVRSLVARDGGESMDMLARGEADVLVADDALIAGRRAASGSPEKYAFLDEGYSVEPYGLVLPKDDPQFKKLVDEVLVGLMKSGEMEKIYNTWFMSPIPPKNYNLNLPMSALNKAAYANPNDKPVN